MTDENNVRTFLATARKHADSVLAEGHTGADAKALIQDLLQITRNFEELLGQSVGMNADARLLKKRFDQAKQEHRATEKELEAVRALFLTVVEDIKIVGNEVANLVRILPPEANSSGQQSLIKIRDAAMKIAEKVAKSKKPEPKT